MYNTEIYIVNINISKFHRASRPFKKTVNANFDGLKSGFGPLLHQQWYAFDTGNLTGLW